MSEPGQSLPLPDDNTQPAGFNTELKNTNEPTVNDTKQTEINAKPVADSDPNVNAIETIRHKLDSLYTAEPTAKAEASEIKQTGTHSKHQQYMLQLQQSGKSQAEITKAWHEYYQNLSDKEKHQVWREFNENQTRSTTGRTAKATTNTTPTNNPQNSQTIKSRHHIYGDTDKLDDTKNTDTDTVPIREKIVATAAKRGRLNPGKNFQSIAFGIGMGLAVIIIFMFGFFNERFIAPFITPSKTASSGPIIMDPASADKVDPAPKVIIPKINVDVPVVYNIQSNSEKDIQNALNDGVVHYPTTALPGQKGNVVIVGHSSNNLFNPGKYKYAFVMLNKLQAGDTFMLNYSGQRYVYKVYQTQIVKPSDTWVLDPQPGKDSIATLITCDPPGTNINRMVVFGEQILPTPDKNTTVATTAKPSSTTKTSVPGNSPSLINRILGIN